MQEMKANCKTLCEIFHIRFIMFCKGLTKRKFFSHLHLHFLLLHDKLPSLIPHYNPSPAHAFSCRFIDPEAAIIAPREVQFYATTRSRSRNVRSRRSHRDVASIARAFEILDSVSDDGGVVEEMATPLLSLLATPLASVRQLRVSDSPFPVEEEGVELADIEAEEFIRRFYEQLRQQQMR